mgnify:CR=1 FL=1
MTKIMKNGPYFIWLALSWGVEAFRIFVGIMEKMDFCLYRRNAMLKPLLEVFLFLLVSLVELKLNKKDKSWVTAFLWLIRHLIKIKNKDQNLKGLFRHNFFNFNHIKKYMLFIIVWISEHTAMDQLTKTPSMNLRI